MGLVLCTFAQVGKRLQDPPAEGSHGVLHTGAQTEHALQVRLFQQQLSVCAQLMRSAQESSHAVHKLRNQTRVRVISLTVMIRHHPAERTRDSLRNFIWFTFRIMQYLLLLIYNYIQHILPYLFMQLLWNGFFLSEEQLFQTNSHCSQVDSKCLMNN